jgi:hypothetical protein
MPNPLEALEESQEPLSRGTINATSSNDRWPSQAMGHESQRESPSLRRSAPETPTPSELTRSTCREALSRLSSA